MILRLCWLWCSTPERQPQLSAWSLLISPTTVYTTQLIKLLKYLCKVNTNKLVFEVILRVIICGCSSQWQSDGRPSPHMGLIYLLLFILGTLSSIRAFGCYVTAGSWNLRTIPSPNAVQWDILSENEFHIGFSPMHDTAIFARQHPLARSQFTFKNV